MTALSLIRCGVGRPVTHYAQGSERFSLCGKLRVSTVNNLYRLEATCKVCRQAAGPEPTILKGDGR
jgi:hypothetical protein